MLACAYNSRATTRARQAGTVLVISLIALVAMTLAALALMRSVDTTNIIAGNLAFRQAAAHASDKGVEAAIACLTANNTSTTLDSNLPACGYSAARGDPNAGETWGGFWARSLNGQSVTLTPDPDANGNTIKYVIHRLCQSTGPSTAAATGCAFAPTVCDQTSSTTVGAGCFTGTVQVYYRITSQVSGPRNTTTYIQAIIAM